MWTKGPSALDRRQSLTWSHQSNYQKWGRGSSFSHPLFCVKFAGSAESWGVGWGLWHRINLRTSKVLEFLFNLIFIIASQVWFSCKHLICHTLLTPFYDIYLPHRQEDNCILGAHLSARILHKNPNWPWPPDPDIWYKMDTRSNKSRNKESFQFQSVLGFKVEKSKQLLYNCGTFRLMTDRHLFFFVSLN